MDYTILFDKDRRTIAEHGTRAFSEILYIPPGKVALLSMYNMYNEVQVTKNAKGETALVAKDCALVHKLSLGKTGDIARKIECGERVDVQGELRGLLANRRLFHEPVYQCGCTWSLNPCNNFALIPTPGFYMLEFFNPNQFDTAYVEYALLSVSDSMAIPDDFKLGSKR